MTEVEARFILGLSPNPTSSEIKSAYHQAAKEHHPDVNGSPERMRMVNEAYQALKGQTFSAPPIQHPPPRSAPLTRPKPRSAPSTQPPPSVTPTHQLGDFLEGLAQFGLFMIGLIIYTPLIWGGMFYVFPPDDSNWCRSILKRLLWGVGIWVVVYCGVAFALLAGKPAVPSFQETPVPNRTNKTYNSTFDPIAYRKAQESLKRKHDYMPDSQIYSWTGDDGLLIISDRPRPAVADGDKVCKTVSGVYVACYSCGHVECK